MDVAERRLRLRRMGRRGGGCGDGYRGQQKQSVDRLEVKLYYDRAMFVFSSKYGLNAVLVTFSAVRAAANEAPSTHFPTNLANARPGSAPLRAAEPPRHGRPSDGGHWVRCES